MVRLTPDESKKYRLLDSEFIRRHGMRQVIGYTLSPDTHNPDYETVTYYGAAWIDPTNIPHTPHYIYILVNPSIPGICKIGFTATTVYDRVRQINSATGVITPWYAVFTYKCPDGRSLEQDIHAHLEDIGVRINPNREGFVIDTDTARNVIESIGKKYKTNSYE